MTLTDIQIFDRDHESPSLISYTTYSHQPTPSNMEGQIQKGVEVYLWGHVNNHSSDYDGNVHYNHYNGHHPCTTNMEHRDYSANASATRVREFLTIVFSNLRGFQWLWEYL